MRQVSWFNHVLKTLWPHVSKTAEKEIVAQAKLSLADICRQASPTLPPAVLRSPELMSTYCYVCALPLVF